MNSLKTLAFSRSASGEAGFCVTGSYTRLPGPNQRRAFRTARLSANIWPASPPTSSSTCIALTCYTKLRHRAGYDTRGIRWISSSSSPCNGSSSSSTRTQSREHAPQDLSPDDQRAYNQLRPVLDDLPGPIDWAVAYGSGVRHQANSQPNAKAPMTDYLLSVPDTKAFHSANMRRNPSHYPMTARTLGAAATGWLTENWGAGVWYVTMVRIRDLEVKYGVISTERLRRDLERWETLYVSGRLHKPVLPLIAPPALLPSLRSNHRSALTLALLLLPPQFSELDLWTRIAGISYAGDPRMSVPGAENPDKVKNIVSGKGAREGMRGIYGDLLGRLGVRWVEEERAAKGLNGMREGGTAGKGGWEWREEGLMSRPEDHQYLANLLASLPASLRDAVARSYGLLPSAQEPLTSVSSSPAGSLSSMSTIPGAEKKGEDSEMWLDIVSGKVQPAAGVPASVAQSPGGSAVKDSTRGDEGKEKEQQVAAVVPLVWRAILLRELQTIIRRPALTQSFKGLFTAGLRKSASYAAAKFGKWLAARRMIKAR